MTRALSLGPRVISQPDPLSPKESKNLTSGGVKVSKEGSNQWSKGAIAAIVTSALALISFGYYLYTNKEPLQLLPNKKSVGPFQCPAEQSPDKSFPSPFQFPAAPPSQQPPIQITPKSSQIQNPAIFKTRDNRLPVLLTLLAELAIEVGTSTEKKPLKDMARALLAPLLYFFGGRGGNNPTAQLPTPVVPSTGVAAARTVTALPPAQNNFIAVGQQAIATAASMSQTIQDALPRLGQSKAEELARSAIRDSVGVNEWIRSSAGTLHATNPTISYKTASNIAENSLKALYEANKNVIQQLIIELRRLPENASNELIQKSIQSVLSKWGDQDV